MKKIEVFDILYILLFIDCIEQHPHRMNSALFDNIKTLQKKMRDLNSDLSDDKEVRICNGKLMLRYITYDCHCGDPDHGYTYKYRDFLGSKYMDRISLKKTIAAIVCTNNYLKNRQIYINLSVDDIFIYRNGNVESVCCDDCDDYYCDDCCVIGNFPSDNATYNDTDGDYDDY